MGGQWSKGSAAMSLANKALQEQQYNKPFKKQQEAERQVTEKNKIRIQEEIDRIANKQRQDEEQHQYDAWRSQQRLAAQELATDMFTYIQRELNAETDTQFRVLNEIKKNGDNVLLANSNGISGVHVFHGLYALETTLYRSTLHTDYIVSEFGKKTFPVFGKQTYTHDFEDGPFAGWRLQATTVLRPLFVFILIIPEMQLRITLRKKTWWML